MPDPQRNKSRRAAAPSTPKTKPKARAAKGLFDPDAGHAAIAHFDEQIREITLEESELGKRARLALRLERDKASPKEIERAVRPFMVAYVKLLRSPANKLESGGLGNFIYPIVLPKKASRKGKRARKSSRKGAHA